MAWRNLTRNLRRTVLTVAAVAIGLAALIFLWSFNDGLHRNMLRNFQDSIIGSLQIHREGFFRRPELATHIENLQEVTGALEAAGVLRWSARLESFSLAAGRDNTEGVMLIGIMPVRERLVTRLAEKVTRGRFLAPGDEYVCVLGATTARNLRLAIGDPVVLMGYDRYGSLVAEEFTLTGIITTGEMGLDRGMALAPLGSVQEMLGMQGRVTDFPASVPERDLERVTADLRRALAGKGYEVMRWYDMFSVMKEWVTLHNGFLYVFMGIVMVIVLAGVLNTVLLSMVERTREFGVLMALGTRQREIAALVVIETVMMGLLGTLSGTVLGVALVQFTGAVGIDLSRLLGSTSRFYVDPVVHTQLDLEHLLPTVLVVLLASILAGLYPAWRAALLEPVEAIRHV